MLLSLLKDDQLSPQSRAVVIRLLASLGPVAKAAIPELYRLIAVDILAMPSSSRMYRTEYGADIKEAVTALGKIGPSSDASLNQKIKERLLKLSHIIDEWNAPVSFTEEAGRSFEALSRTKPIAAGTPPAAVPEVHGTSALRESLPHLIELTRPLSPTAEAAEKTIKKLEPASVISLLKDPSTKVRESALKAIGIMKLAEARAAIYDQMQRFAVEPSLSGSIEEWTLISLGISVTTDREPLLKLLKNPSLSPSRRAAVVRLIARLGRGAQPAIADLLKLISTDFSTLSEKEARERLDGFGDIAEAVSALAVIGPSSDPALRDQVMKRLTEISKMESLFIRHSAADTLAALRKLSVLPPHMKGERFLTSHDK